MATPSRGKLLLYALLTVALLTHIPLLQRAVRLAPGMFGRDKTTQYEQRFTAIRNSVPPHSIVGYLTDLPTDSLSTDAVAVEHFYLAQYALAPAVLTLGDDANLIVGNFTTPELPGRYKQLTLVKDFGDGLFLLRGERQ